MRLIQKLGDWFDLRLQLGKPDSRDRRTPVPRETASWFYVFGSAALTCFMLQLVTGILLALIYVPSQERHGTVCRPLIMASLWVGLYERCTAGARTSWSRSS